MFVVQHNSGLYFHNKGKIILFESQQEASNFINMFIQYSMSRLSQEGRVEDVMSVPMVINKCKIISVDFDINNVKCGTIFARDLFE